MSHTIPFDTLHHFERMVEAGFTEKQAKAQTEAIAGLVDEKLATKQDIDGLKKDINELKQQMLIFGSIILAGITILGFLISFHH